MAKYGAVTYTGKSGKKYEFTAYSWDTNFKENYGAAHNWGRTTVLPKSTVRSGSLPGHRYVIWTAARFLWNK